MPDARVGGTEKETVQFVSVQVISDNLPVVIHQERENDQLKYDNNGDPVLRTVQTAKVSEIEFLIVDKSRLSQQNTQQPAHSNQSPVVVAQSETADNIKDDLPF